jgi:hypothetical protein
VTLRLAVGAALIAAAASGCGSGGGSGVPDRFSGTWKLRDDGRTIPLRQVARAEGERALQALGGRPCPGRALYFRATYFDRLAHLAGCATGDGRTLAGRFDDNGIHGRIVQRLVLEHPPTFRARVLGDSGPPFTVTAVRIGP